MSKTVIAPWFDDEAQWESDVTAWLTAVAQAENLGEIRQVVLVKKRPWSCVQRVIFDQGAFYFKACSAGGTHEPKLLEFLTELGFGQLVGITAVNYNHNWLLLADGGQPLRAVSSSTEQLQRLATLLPHYAQLQIDSMRHIDALLELGLPNRSASRLPTLFRDLAEQQQSTGQTIHSVANALEIVCEQLSQTAYHTALDHGDLHTGNVLIKDQKIAICDWGDASLTFPFCSMLVLLEITLHGLSNAEQHQWGNDLRDAYLEPWLSFAPRQQLLTDFYAGGWLGHLIRLLDFAHMFIGGDEAVLAQWRGLIDERLAFWLDLPLPTQGEQGDWLGLLKLN